MKAEAASCETCRTTPMRSHPHPMKPTGRSLKPTLTRLGTSVAAAVFCLIVTSPGSMQALGQTTSPQDGVETDVMRAPEDGGPRRWSAAAGGTLNLYDGPSVDATIVDVVADGTVLSNRGCEQGDDQIWCTVQPLSGGAPRFAAAASLVPARGPDGLVPMGPDDSRRRARKRDFDERGEIRCAQERGQALGTCGVAIARSGGGDATVVVTFPNGFARNLYFVHGEFISANATMSGVGTDTDWRTDGGLHMIRVDDQRYELLETLIIGD